MFSKKIFLFTVLLTVFLVQSLSSQASIVDIFLNETAYPSEGLVSDLSVDAASTPKWLLLDNSWSQTNSYWQTGHADQAPVWALITLSQPSRINQTIWSAYNDQYEPTDFAVQGSNDTITWINITRIENNPSQENTTIHFVDGAGDNWLYYRMYVDRWNGGVSSGGGMASLEWSGFNYSTPSASIVFDPVKNNATAYTVTGHDVNWTTTISSGDSLSYCWFTQNDSGTFTNSSVIDCTGALYTFDQTITVTADTDAYVCGFFGANTSTNFHDQSPYSCFTVKDGLFHINISAIERTHSTTINEFNVTINSSTWSTTRNTTTGTLDVGVNASTFSVLINSTYGYAYISPWTVTTPQNLTVKIPNVVLDAPTQGLETSAAEFTLTVNSSDASQFSNVGFILDNIFYVVTKTESAVNTVYSVNTTLPDLDDFSAPLEYYWNYSLYQNQESERLNITVSEVLFSHCPDLQLGNVSLNFSVFDEKNASKSLTASVEAYFSIYTQNREDNVNVSFSLVGQDSYRFCLEPNNATVYTDAEFGYTTTNGFTHNWYLNIAQLTNSTSYIKAFNFDTTTGISDLRGTTRYISTFQTFPNVFATMERRYIGEGIWRSVQMRKSGEFGLIFFNIEEEDTEYRFTFKDANNTLLKQTNSNAFSCDNSICEFNFLMSPASISIPTANPIISASFNNNTKILTVDWSDSTGLTQTLRVKATKETLSETITACDTTSSSSIGTIQCNLSAYTGSIFVQTYVNDDLTFSQWFDLTTQKIGTIIGKADGAFYSAVILIVIVGIGLFSAVGAIIAVMAGLAFIAILGLWTPLNTALYILFAIIAAYIGLKIRK